MTPEEYQAAAAYWETHTPPGKEMPTERLAEEITRYLNERDTCALATAHVTPDGLYVRNTPIEYRYVDGVFYLFSEGGKKFASLATNPAVSLAIFDHFSGFQSLRSVQVMGQASVIPYEDPEYAVAAAARGLQLSALEARGTRLHLIKVVPSVLETIQSHFAKEGYSVRQTWRV